MILSLIIIDNVNKVRVGNSNRDKEAGVNIQRLVSKNKLASLEATLVRNSAHSLISRQWVSKLTYSLTVVKCRATSVAKKQFLLALLDLDLI